MTAQAPIAELSAREPNQGGHTDAVRDMFGRIAPTYDLLNRVMSGGLDVAWRQRAIDALEGAPRGPSLDLCAGTLDLTVMLDRARPHQRLIASDFSEPMLLQGRSKVPRAELIVADAQTLPFEDRSIAAVVCGFFRPAQLVTRLFHTAYANVLLPAVGGLLSGDRGAYAYLARSMDGFLFRAEYEHAVARAGFVRIEAEDLTLGVASIIRAVAQG